MIVVMVMVMLMLVIMLMMVMLMLVIMLMMLMPIEIGHVVVVVLVRRVHVDGEVAAVQSRLRRSPDPDGESLRRDAVQGTKQDVPVRAEVEQRADCHIPADSRRAFKIQDPFSHKTPFGSVHADGRVPPRQDFLQMPGAKSRSIG